SRDEVLLHTHHVVRDDAQSLYGFESRDELMLFEMLITVSGVGPKAAMALLATSRPADIAAAIASGDAAALARAPGVGKKTAERLIVDLRGRIGRGGGADGAAGPAPLDDDAQAALVALGYTPAEAATALHGVPAKGRASTEERVSAALRAAGRPARSRGRRSPVWYSCCWRPAEPEAASGTESGSTPLFFRPTGSRTLGLGESEKKRGSAP